MKYMLLIYGRESAWTESEREQCIHESMAICEELEAQGKWVASSPLQSVSSATSLRIREGRRQITDGPFAETTEQLGGYYILDVDDLDEAIAIASRLPPAKKGTVEIRPLCPLPERGEVARPTSFCRNLEIAASRETVFKALTTQSGIEGWWTQSCSVGRTVGEESTFRFGTTHKTVRIDALLLNERVDWRCTEAHIDLPKQIARPDEWVGTRIEFSIANTSSKTCELKLMHEGLTNDFECYEVCSAGWEQFLSSLKQYCETGNGSPYLISEISNG